MTRPVATLGLFLLTGLAVFSPVLGIGFLSDDFEARQLADTPSGWRQILSQPIGGLVWRPLGFLTFLADAWLFGDWSFGWHLVNLSLHVGNAWLISLLARRLFSRPGMALAAGAAFLLYPAHHEAVSWLSGRFDVLATTFVLLTLLFAELSRTRPRVFWLSLATAAAAYLTKESTFVLPLILLGRELIDRTKPLGRRLWPRVGLHLIGLLAVVVGRSIVIGQLVGGYEVFGQPIALEWSGQTLTSLLVSPIQMLSRMVNWPYALVRFPELQPLIGPLVERLGWLDLGVGLGLGLTLWRLPASARRPAVWLLGAGYLTLLPVVSLLPYVSRTLEASRLWYLPSVGLTLLLVFLIDRLRPSSPRAVVVTLLLIFTAGLMINSGPWRLAGREVTAIRSDLERRTPNLPAGRFVVFRSVPDNRFGAYVFRRGFGEYLDQLAPTLFAERAMLGRSYQPSFPDCATARQAAGRLLVLDWDSSRVSFVERPDLDRRLLELLAENEDNAKIVAQLNAAVALPERADAWTARRLVLHRTDQAVVIQPQPGGWLAAEVPDLNPAIIGSLNLEVSGSANRSTIPVSLYWSSQDEPYDEFKRHLIFPVSLTDRPDRVVVRFCQYLAWPLANPLRAVRLQFPAGLQTLTIHRLTFDAP